MTLNIKSSLIFQYPPLDIVGGSYKKGSAVFVVEDADAGGFHGWVGAVCLRF